MGTQKPLTNIKRRHLLQAAAGAALAATSVADLLQGSSVAQAEVIQGIAENIGPIKVLAFDFQGSCMNFYDPINEMGQAINARKGLALDWASLTKEWVSNLYQLVGASSKIYVPAAHLYRRALDQLLEQQHLSDTFNNAEREQMMTVWDRMTPWPDTVEGLTRLKRKFALTTLSNASMASVFQSVRRHGLPFDQVLTGELVQAYKPAPQVYNLIVAMLGYKVEEVMFCATHLADLREAKKFGYKTAWWPRLAETGPGQLVDTSPKPFVDISVSDIVDLAERLGA